MLSCPSPVSSECPLWISRIRSMLESRGYDDGFSFFLSRCKRGCVARLVIHRFHPDILELVPEVSGLDS